MRPKAKWVLCGSLLVALGVSCASGSTDEGPDNDGDGYGEGVDCDDTDASRNPAAQEICDELDNDCDGQIDEPDAAGAPKWWIDGDGDGFGTDADTKTQCLKPEGYVDIGGDCRDNDPDIYPGAPEDCAEDLDRNCDGSSGYDDVDNDGWPACQECNDMLANVHPEAPEICDGIDNDCDMEIDEDAPEMMCGAVDNGSPVCTEEGCAVGSCDTDWYDVNGVDDDGCECLADPVPVSQGATCPSAIDLGNFTDAAGDLETFTGNDAAGGRAVWYVFTAIDDADSAGDEFHVDIRFTNNPSQAYELEVWRNGCPNGSGTQLATGEKDMVDWFTDQNFTSTNCGGTAPCGEGNCVPTVGVAGANQCNSDTATFFVRITREDSLPSCDGYEIEISNGVY